MGNDSDCQTSSARVVGWPKRKGSQVEVQRVVGWFSTVPLIGSGIPGKPLTGSCSSISHL